MKKKTRHHKVDLFYFLACKVLGWRNHGCDKIVSKNRFSRAQFHWIIKNAIVFVSHQLFMFSNFLEKKFFVNICILFTSIITWI